MGWDSSSSHEKLCSPELVILVIIEKGSITWIGFFILFFRSSQISFLRFEKTSSQLRKEYFSPIILTIKNVPESSNAITPNTINGDGIELSSIASL